MPGTATPGTAPGGRGRPGGAGSGTPDLAGTRGSGAEAPTEPQAEGHPRSRHEAGPPEPTEAVGSTAPPTVPIAGATTPWPDATSPAALRLLLRGAHATAERRRRQLLALAVAAVAAVAVAAGVGYALGRGTAPVQRAATSAGRPAATTTTMHRSHAPASAPPGAPVLPHPTTLDVSVATAAGNGLDNVVVTVKSPTGRIGSVATGAGGRADIGVTNEGTYVVSITVPPGYEATSPSARDVPVSGRGGSLTVTFTLAPVTAPPGASSTGAGSAPA